MTDLASLVVRLEAQTAQYDAKLDAANRKLDKFAKSTDTHFGKIQRSFNTLNKGLGLVGVGVSLAVITTGLTRTAAAAIEFGDEVNKASIKTGIAVEEFSELAYAAKQNDIELDALSTSLKKMQQFISQANTGGDKQIEILDALQIRFEDLRALAPDKQFELIADRLSRIKDPADRTRVAVELFGRAGADLLPMFEDGAEGIRKAREEAERMGATLTGEQAKALAEADDAIKRMGQAWDGMTRSLTAGVAPGLTRVFDAMTNVLQKEPQVWTLAEAWDAVASAFKKNGIGTTWTDIIGEMQDGPTAARRPTSGLPPGGRNRKPTPIDFSLPDSGANDAAEKAAREAERARLRALEQQADAYKTVLDNGMAAMGALQTETEQQIAQYHEMKFALEELARTYPNMADEVAVALGKLENEWGFEDIQITAEEVFPKKEQEKLSVFWEEAARNFQDILSDFLFDPFSKGIDGMLDDFLQMLQRMAAQAIAAQIGQKIFGAPTSGGGSSGGGWLDTAISWGTKLLGAWGGGGSSAMSGFEDIAVTAQKIPMPYSGPRATGGDVLAGNRYRVGENGRAEWFIPQTNGRIERDDSSMRKGDNYFNFTVPLPAGGTVSRQTQQQIMAAAARGVAHANRRNN